jgi:hypothetical protein
MDMLRAELGDEFESRYASGLSMAHNEIMELALSARAW